MPRQAAWSLAFALVLSVSFFLPCFDACPDDADGESCPPVCANCVSCPRSGAIATSTPVPTITTTPSTRVGWAEDVARLPLLADEILHVPLALVS